MDVDEPVQPELLRSELNGGEAYYGAMAFERPKGHYVDHVHIVDERIGGKLQPLQIDYIVP